MRISEHAPSHCAACYGQYVDRRYVDFEASYDGPIIEGGVMGEGGVVATTIPVSIDELVICENCLAAAASLLGMSAENREQIEAANAEAQNLRERLAGQADYAKKLEAALAARPAAKPKGAPRG